MEFPMKLEATKLQITMNARRFLAAAVALALAALAYSSALAHGDAELGEYEISVGFLNEPAYEGVMNAVEVRVTKPADSRAAAGAGAGSHEHSSDAAHSHSHEETLESEIPIAVSVSAEVGANGGVSVGIAADGGWRWAPDSVDMEHEPGAGHAHIYVDGVKIGRVYGPGYDLAGLDPGERHIRVTLNSNDHKQLTVNGEPVEATAVVTIPGAAHTHMAGVEGLEKTLKVDITHVASETTRTLELSPLADEPGHYLADLIPTSQGHYRIRLYGEIEGEAIDAVFDSFAGGGEFSDVEDASALQFPQSVASAREIESAARGAQASAAAAQEAAANANDAAGGASAIGIAGIAVGVLGVALGGVALAVALRRGRRNG